jgi:uncharacterized membrane protein YidH (DUF202 family)
LVFEVIGIWVVKIEVVEVSIETVLVDFVKVSVAVVLVLVGFITAMMVSFDFYQVDKTNNSIGRSLVDQQQSYLPTSQDA